MIPIIALAPFHQKLKGEGAMADRKLREGVVLRVAIVVGEALVET